MSAQGPSGPLSGIRIIDLSSVVLGPFATQILGDLGAEIIKIEPPGGDTMRHSGDCPNPGMGPIYLQMNRNKRSVELDLKTAEGLSAMQTLLEGADLFLHNIRAPGIARLGLDYQAVCVLNPEIVYVHCVGFDSRGPYADRAAYDDLVQAACGIPSLMALGNAQAEPRYVPSVIADKTAGLHAVYAAIAGLFHRERTGQGQFIEVPLMETFASFMLAENLFGHSFVPPRGPIGYPRATDANRKPYKTLDGYIALMPYTTAQWTRFLQACGRPSVLQDARFATQSARAGNYPALYALLAEICATRTTAQWVELLEAQDIAYTIPKALDEVVRDAQLRGSGFITDRVHPTEGVYVAMAPPVRFGKTPATVRSDAPALGQDTAAVLRDAGVDEPLIAKVLAAAQKPEA